MKKILLLAALIIILWPGSAKATLFTYDIGDPAGNVYLDLIYDAVQAVNAPFREPDHLLVNFGYELWEPMRDWCNTPTTFPCPMGTGGSHTFNRGEFNFERNHALVLASIAEPSGLLLTGGGLIVSAVVLRRRKLKK